MSFHIEPMMAEDWDAVLAIYLEGIATRNATFETSAPEWEKWDSGHRADCRLVSRQGGNMLGWAALSPVSGRCVYAGVAEVSIYITAAARGQGVGRALLTQLVNESEAAGLWTLQAGILRENAASRALHAACGFRELGYRERVGQLDGVWRDVILMERRSGKTG